MIGEDTEELPIRMLSHPIDEHIQISVTRIEQAHTGQLRVEPTMVGTARQSLVGPAMPSNKHSSDRLVVNLARRMKRVQRLLDQMPKPVLILQLAAPRVGRIPRSLRKDEHDV